MQSHLWQWMVITIGYYDIGLLVIRSPSGLSGLAWYPQHIALKLLRQVVQSQVDGTWTERQMISHSHRGERREGGRRRGRQRQGRRERKRQKERKEWCFVFCDLASEVEQLYFYHTEVNFTQIIQWWGPVKVTQLHVTLSVLGTVEVWLRYLCRDFMGVGQGSSEVMSQYVSLTWARPCQRPKPQIHKKWQSLPF